jgi:hypothetical protein
MDILFNFVEGQCIKYEIDASHGVKHAKGTYSRAKKLLKYYSDITQEEETVTLYSAALHDMCDSKYCDSKEALNDIYDFLVDIQLNKEEVRAILNIITTMSYSKLKKNVSNGIPVFPDHGKWQRAYDIARNADLLEGFIVARCIIYNKELYPEKLEDEHWERANTIFKERVFTYVSEGWINLPAALEMVPALENEALRCLKKRSMDWPDPFEN